MVTTIPDVRVTQAEGGTGFLVTCGSCPKFRAMRLMRLDADIAATGHVRSHGRPHPADHEDD